MRAGLLGTKLSFGLQPILLSGPLRTAPSLPKLISQSID
jgi:hypothetical protein